MCIPKFGVEAREPAGDQAVPRPEVGQHEGGVVCLLLFATRPPREPPTLREYELVEGLPLEEVRLVRGVWREQPVVSARATHPIGRSCPRASVERLRRSLERANRANCHWLCTPARLEAPNGSVGGLVRVHNAGECGRHQNGKRLVGLLVRRVRLRQQPAQRCEVCVGLLEALFD